jgi:hypothetical protein
MFDIHQSVRNRHGEQDERLVYKYIDGLMKAFAESPEARPLIEQGENVGWAGMMLEYYFNHIGGDFDTMTLPDFNEIVFDLFPRKVSTPPESAPGIIAELKAFWSFVHRQYGLKSAEPILATLTDKAVADLRDDLADPSNYGMAKSLVMGGMKAGYDMTTQEGMDAYVRDYNASLPHAALPEGIENEEEWDEEGPPPSLPAPPTRQQREQKRKDRKRQRQARKRNRK